MDNNTWISIIAVVGACAWLPPIIQLLIKIFTKPKLTIFPHRTFELGYTTNGSIINFSLALSAENSECLVTNVELEIEGPNREQHRLSWQWIEEKLYEIEYAQLGVTPVRKQQNAIAIKVLKENLVEKTFGFHENTFKSAYDRSFRATTQRFELLRRNGQDINTLRASNEFETFRTLLENSLIWREGAYQVTIKVNALNISQPFIKRFDFALTATDIQRLQTNIETCRTVLEQFYFPQQEVNAAQWNWINPTTILV